LLDVKAGFVDNMGIVSGGPVANIHDIKTKSNAGINLQATDFPLLIQGVPKKMSIGY